MSDQSRPTIIKVEKLEDTLRTRRGDLREEEGLRDQLSDQLTRAYTDGKGDPDELSTKLAATNTRISIRK